MIEGIEVAVDREAVVVTAREPLTVLSSAFVRGGLAAARAIVNLQVPKDLREDQADGLLPRFTVDRAAARERDSLLLPLQLGPEGRHGGVPFHDGAHDPRQFGDQRIHLLRGEVPLGQDRAGCATAPRIIR